MTLDRDGLLRIFRAESEEGLAQVEGCLVQLERNPRDKELVDAVFRALHTLKGDAQTLGFSWLSELAHGLEDVLVAIRERRLEIAPDLVSLLLRGVDALRSVVPAAIEGDETRTPEHVALLATLRTTVVDQAATRSVGAQCEAASRDVLEGDADLSRTLRVDLSKLDRLLTLNGEIAIARGRTRLLLEEYRALLPREIVELHAETDRLFLDLQELVLGARMLPIAPVFSRYERTVRDTATALGKRVRLLVDAEGVELDAAVIERVRGPLGHMVRNAVDHGIETPEVRARLGKDPCGTIALSAHQDGGSIVIEVRDDGAGLDRRRIVERAEALGLHDDLARAADEAVYELIFAPGFSTVDSVTKLSGRGVGMDVVRRSVDALRGKVLVESEPGLGTAFTIRLPLTLTIIEGLLVEVGDERFVIPLASVVDCVEFCAASGEANAERGVANVRGRVLPYIRLKKAFALEHRPSGRENVVVVRHGEHRIGLVVDALLGDAQTIVRPLGRWLRDVPGLGGSAILGDGRIALILDVVALLRHAARELAA